MAEKNTKDLRELTTLGLQISKAMTKAEVQNLEKKVKETVSKPKDKQ